MIKMKPKMIKWMPKTCVAVLAAVLAARAVSAAWLPTVGPAPLRFASPIVASVVAPSLAPPPAAAPSEPVSTAAPVPEPTTGTAGVVSPEPSVVTQVKSPESPVDPGGSSLGLGDLFLSQLLPNDADLTAPQESISLLLRQPRLFLPPEVGMSPRVSFTPPTTQPQLGRSTYLSP